MLILNPPCDQASNDNDDGKDPPSSKKGEKKGRKPNRIVQFNHRTDPYVSYRRDKIARSQHTHWEAVSVEVSEAENTQRDKERQSEKNSIGAVFKGKTMVFCTTALQSNRVDTHIVHCVVYLIDSLY